MLILGLVLITLLDLGHLLLFMALALLIGMDLKNITHLVQGLTISS
jgi:hypothetical protein